MDWKPVQDVPRHSYGDCSAQFLQCSLSRFTRRWQIFIFLCIKPVEKYIKNKNIYFYQSSFHVLVCLRASAGAAGAMLS